MRRRPTEHPTAVDLYCGVGGLSLGVMSAGFHLLGAVDFDQHALDAYRVNFPKVRTAKLDLSTATAKDICRELKLSGSTIDLLIGGPPCQGFSYGGVNDRRDPRNEGVFAFARLVGELRPRFFVMENVRGFLADRHAVKRRRFCRAIKDVGYRIRLPIETLNAADYGVPQRRVRAFAVGCAENETLPEYPNADRFPKPTVRDAIGDLALLDRHSKDFDVDEYTGPFGEPSDFAIVLRKRPNGRLVTRVTGCLRSRHADDVIERFRATRPGSQESVSRYYRLAWDGISPTLRAGTGPDHGSHTAPRPIHPSKARCITVREAARLHSFPDWFQFDGTRWHGFRQIGNSVPPLLGQVMFAKVMETCQRNTL